mmetsp:Transcript_14617/g.23798  ORF Transcript_14617/g.23798 Transcript_14617/m.23798 type:complete len:142 (+) Transcript_14617:178-603(+)
MKLTTLLGVAAALMGVDASIDSIVITNQLSYTVTVQGAFHPLPEGCNAQQVDLPAGQSNSSMAAKCFEFNQDTRKYGFMNGGQPQDERCTFGCWDAITIANGCSGTTAAVANDKGIFLGKNVDVVYKMNGTVCYMTLTKVN